VTLTPLEVPAGLAVPAVRAEPLDRLPGTAADDPFLRLAAGWLIGHPANTATAYRRDLEAWTRWCAQLDVHPLAAERHHVDLWVRHLTTQPQPRTGRPAAAATVARKLSALAGSTTKASMTPRSSRTPPPPPSADRRCPTSPRRSG